MPLESHTPPGTIQEKWDYFKEHCHLVNPANKKKHRILVVGTGLAGASAAATLAQLGYSVQSFCIQDSPRRAHSIAAQGGINATKNYPNDGDSVWRLFYDTLKGGDYRSREANVYRLAQISNQIIDQCVAQGVPFARDYGGLLANRSFGGAQVSRTFYARGQTGQQLLLGAYSALMRMVSLGQLEIFPRREMLDLVLIDGKARGIIVRNLLTGQLERYSGDAVLLCTGGYGNVYFLSTNGRNSNVTAAWRCHKRGAFFANPCFTQIHPTCIPVSGEYQSKLTLMSESLRNDGRVWVPKDPHDTRSPDCIPESDRDYYLERKYPSFGNLVPRDVASRNAKAMTDQGKSAGGRSVYLDFRDAIASQGKDAIAQRYGNLFQMYQRITDSDPYQTPMRIYPAVHYTMGGLWVDYRLMSNIPGLFVLGEANFSDHGANRLGASALMQGLADGYFIISYTLGDYLASHSLPKVSTEDDAFEMTEAAVREKIERLLSIQGRTSAQTFHRRIGQILWDFVGISRNSQSLMKAIALLKDLKQEFWQDLNVPPDQHTLNQNLETAGRVADFLELGELMALDALNREESCGCHLREEHQTADGEALRNDQDYRYVSAWKYDGDGSSHGLVPETLDFKDVRLTQRSYI